MYSFDDFIERRNTYSVKWDETERIFGVKDVLPLWVADMDFKAPAEVLEALAKRVEHGVFGYTSIPASLKQAVCDWMVNKHEWQIDSKWLSFSPGVVPALATAIQAFTSPGDKVIVQTPVYYPFFQLVEKNNRELVLNPLQLINGKYEMDFADLKEKIKGAKLLLLCSPHNPGGRVWSKEELTKLGELCLEHNVIVVSDEIHSDLVFSGSRHTPFASISEEFAQISVTCIAPTKTFNLAGLQSAISIIPNRTLKKQFDSVQQRQGFFTLNTFAVVGTEAAYRHGNQWLNDLLKYLAENVEFTCSFIEKHLPKLKVIKPEATYLVWIDCRELQKSDQELKQLLLQKGKIAVEPGNKFGEGGTGFIRLNVACTRETLQEALKRLATALGEL
ncbi:cystathionine beta-lyase [Thermolongibacillus altinsuensis]|uniref:cysteine-S-conjugate beta-lyase n=1 Tax=Thermolongibacillus altinsuensis TaxID=575256 RepID=A0A4R1QBK9_9BACL|nr:MalY/PatB family protein [Thermolongibacillus altinsuensis]TCL47310.1 cystathionine beta-lyase [Thermolongibacillus altinsuensis]